LSPFDALDCGTQRPRRTKVATFLEALVQTLEDIQKANVPDDLREAAFKTGLTVNLGFEPRERGEPRLSISRPKEGTPDSDEESPLSKLAARLGLAVEVVGDVYDDADGKIDLIVGSGKLPRHVAAASKDIALLVAAGRQGSEEEEWTPFSDIRQVCGQYGKLDSSNFATTMKEMQDVFGFRSPSARKREVRVNRPGWERAAALVARLASGDG
jgi:hypothetical protein